MSQIGFCPLVWMKRSTTLNNHINGLDKRALSSVYNNFSLSLSKLLEKDKFVAINQSNLQTLAYGIFEIKFNITPETLTEIFPLKESIYNITATDGSESKMWDI